MHWYQPQFFCEEGSWDGSPHHSEQGWTRKERSGVHLGPWDKFFLQGPRIEFAHSKNMNGEKNYTFIFIHLSLKFSISFDYESKQQARVV